MEELLLWSYCQMSVSEQKSWFATRWTKGMPELFRVIVQKLCLHCKYCMCFKYLRATGGTGSSQKWMGCGEGLCTHSTGSWELKRFQQQENWAQINLNKQEIWIILKQKCSFLNSQVSESRAASGHGISLVRVSIVLKWTVQQKNQLVLYTGLYSSGTENLLYLIFRPFTFFFCFFFLKGDLMSQFLSLRLLHLFLVIFSWNSSLPGPTSYILFHLFLLLCLSPAVP